MNADGDPPERVDLASERDFRLGAMDVSPSACRIRGPGREFRVEPRVMEVLVVLVRHAGQTVTRDRLIEACWGGRFVSDDAVARAVAQVRALARRVEPAPFSLETVPKVGFRLTELGAAEDPPQPRPPPATAERRTGRLRRRLAAAGVLGGAVLLAAAAWLGSRALQPSPPRGAGRIDVMAYVARADTPVARQVARTITETLIHQLALGGVSTSDTALTPDAGGAAEFRIVGTVDREADHYLVTSQVLDSKTGVVLVSQQYRRGAATLQASAPYIAWTLAATLQCALEDRKSAPAPLSLEGLGLYLNACDAVFGERASPDRMLAVTRRLVKTEPKFAGAHAMHAIAAGRAAVEDEPGEPAARARLRAEARRAADRALRLDPHTPKALCGLALAEGVLSDIPSQDWLAEDGYLQDALAMDPDLPPTRHEYTALLRNVGRWNAAIDMLRGSNAAGDARAGADPRVATILAAQGDMPAAERELARLQAEVGLRDAAVDWTIAFWWKDPQVALETLRSLGDDVAPPADRTCYREYLERLRSGRQGPWTGLPQTCDGLETATRVRMLARQGDVDGAFRLLARAPRYAPQLFYYPEMRAVRADPRFWALAGRLRLVDYWRTSGHWPDFCAAPGLGYDCRSMAATTAAR